MSKIICLTGPSGVGKTSYARRLCEIQGFQVAQVVTTRPPRNDDGDHYYYISPEMFNNLILQSKFIEYDHYLDYKYGTLIADFELQLSKCHYLVLDLTPEGVKQVLNNYPDSKVIIILPDDESWLHERLCERNTQSLAEINARQSILAEYLTKLKELEGHRIYANYHPSTWDETYAQILEAIRVV